MKKLALTVALSVGMAGAANAQDAPSLLGAVNGAIPNLTTTVEALVAGDVGATTQGLANTVNGLTADLTVGTPLAPLAASGAALTNTVVSVSAGLTPTLNTLVAPVAIIASPLAPTVGSVADVVNGFVPVQDALPGLLGTVSVVGNPTFVTGITRNLVSQLAAGNLNVVSEIVGLVGITELPGLGDLSSVGGGASGLDTLDPAVLTGLLGGGLPGLDALPLDALDPAILAGLLDGGLPTLPATPAL